MASTQMEFGEKVPVFEVLNTRFQTIVEVQRYPSSMIEDHVAMDWPENCYGVNRIQDWNGDYPVDDLLFLPLIPLSWERRMR